MADKTSEGFFHFAKSVAMSSFKALIGDADELALRRSYKAAREEARSFVTRCLPEGAMPERDYEGSAYSGRYPKMEFKSFQKGVAETLEARAVALALGREDPLKGCLSWDDLAARVEGCSMSSPLRKARWAFREARDSDRYGPGMSWTLVVRETIESVPELAFDRFLRRGEACAAAAQREMISQSMPSKASEPAPAKPKSRSL